MSNPLPKDLEARKRLLSRGWVCANVLSILSAYAIPFVIGSLVKHEHPDFGVSFLLATWTTSVVCSFVDFLRTENRLENMEMPTPTPEIRFSRREVVRIVAASAPFVGALALGGALSGYALAQSPLAISGLVLGGVFGTVLAVTNVVTFLFTMVCVGRSFGRQVAIGTPPESVKGVKKA